MSAEELACECSTLGDFAAVGMGDAEGRDERILATIASVLRHGGAQWWLDAATCSACGEHWMIAQEERIHDNYYLKRLTTDQMKGIVERADWPPDFLRFEDVIKLGPDNKQVARFFDTNDLTDTVKELIEARNDISAAEVAYLFCLSEGEAQRLMDRAARMSWAQIRPFA